MINTEEQLLMQISEMYILKEESIPKLMNYIAIA